MKKILIPVIICISVITGLQCKGPDGSQGSIGPAGTALTGTLTGHLYFVDQNDSPLAMRNGAIVSITGTNISDTTDSTGQWTLRNVPTGIYQITFSKSGFDSFIIPTEQFVGGGTDYVGNIYLIQEQTYAVTSENAKDTLLASVGWNVIQVIDSMNSPIYTTGKRVIIFVGTTPSVSSAPGTYSYSSVVTPSTSSNSKSITRTFSSEELVSAGFSSGTTVYFRSYGASEYYETYRDTVTGRLYYVGLSYIPSNVVSTVVP